MIAPMRSVSSFLQWIAAATVLFTVSAAAHAEERVDLELVLAVDISGSMDPDEQELQRQGYLRALRDPEVIQAIRSGAHGRIAVTYVEWAGNHSIRVAVPWMLIDGEATTALFAARLAASPLRTAHDTSISGALAFSGDLFDGNDFAGLRRVIDVSGDGPNKQGAPVTVVRDLVVSKGITVNGLPVMLKPHRRSGSFDVSKLDIYYEDCVIGGFGAFIVPVRALSEFAAAVRRKLVLEIAGVPPRPIPAQFSGRVQRIDCLIGEKLWRGRILDWDN